MIAIRTTPHLRLAALWKEALELEGLDAEVGPAADGRWEVRVDFEASERAAIVLAELDAEDPDAPPRTIEDEEDEEREAQRRARAAAARPAWGRSWAGLAIAWVLLAMFPVTGTPGSGSAWQARGANDTGLFLREPWRAITALTLHADIGHVLANSAALALFVTLAAWRSGPGLSIAVVVASGVLGNAFTALVYRGGIVSIGASTAAFGALGLLAAQSLVEPARRRAAWVVFGASLALLAFLGTAPGTDVLSHLSGFASGLVLGLLAAGAWPGPPAPRIQWALTAASAALVAGAWAVAFLR